MSNVRTASLARCTIWQGACRVNTVRISRPTEVGAGGPAAGRRPAPTRPRRAPAQAGAWRRSTPQTRFQSPAPSPVWVMRPYLNGIASRVTSIGLFGNAQQGTSHPHPYPLQGRTALLAQMVELPLRHNAPTPGPAPTAVGAGKRVNGVVGGRLCRPPSTLRGGSPSPRPRGRGWGMGPCQIPGLFPMGVTSGWSWGSFQRARYRQGIQPICTKRPRNPRF